MPSVVITDPMFRPAARQIASIDNAALATITTTFAHGYISGTIVRLYIPFSYGMQQAEHAVGAIVVTGDTTFTMGLDTSTYDTFSIPATVYQYPQVVPIGEINSILTAAFMNVL